MMEMNKNAWKIREFLNLLLPRATIENRPLCAIMCGYYCIFMVFLNWNVYILLLAIKGLRNFSPKFKTISTTINDSSVVPRYCFCHFVSIIQIENVESTRKQVLFSAFLSFVLFFYHFLSALDHLLEVVK